MVYFGGFFAKLGHFAGFSLYIINFAVRISKSATERGHYIFRMPRRSFRVSEALLSRVKRSSEGCSIAQKAVA